MQLFKKGVRIGEWKVDAKLGEGAFGYVYKVVHNSKGDFAMKTEKADVQTSALKIEVYVLRSLQERNAKHFCQILDHGRVSNFNYIVMTLVGLSFSDLLSLYGRNGDQGHNFTTGCALSVGIKCVDAIEELHSLVGILHRDIKPGNFAIGREDKRKVILIDFGMARKYLNEAGEIRPPRYAAGFRGTLRYAPISCHIARELCRKDDLESWLYMQIEMTKGKLPWVGVNDRDEICRIKEKCRKEVDQKLLFGGCPSQYLEILKYIDVLRYYNTPDYKRITNLLRFTLASNNLNEYPYDWEPTQPNETTK